MAKKIFVAGASRGIGEQTALALAHALPVEKGEEPIDYGFEPTDVAISYLRYDERALRVVEAIRATGRNTTAVQMDITDPASVVEAIDRLEDWTGTQEPTLDGAVFNVAGGLEGDGDDEVFSEDINHYGQWLLLGTVRRILADEAQAVYVQSHWGHLAGEVEPPPFEGYATYVAEPKRRGENSLRERVGQLEGNIGFRVVTGGIVDDTPVGRRGIRNFPEWAAGQDKIGNLIKARKMGIAIAQAVTNPNADPVIWVGATEEDFRATSGLKGK